MSQVIDPQSEIEERIMHCTSLPKDQLMMEIVNVATNYYGEFTKDIRPTKNWCWATWITEKDISNPIDIFCEAAFKVAEKFDCLSDVDIKSKLININNETEKHA